jgi:hypothetical protein
MRLNRRTNCNFAKLAEESVPLADGHAFEESTVENHFQVSLSPHQNPRFTPIRLLEYLHRRVSQINTRIYSFHIQKRRKTTQANEFTHTLHIPNVCICLYVSACVSVHVHVHVCVCGTYRCLSMCKCKCLRVCLYTLLNESTLSLMNHVGITWFILSAPMPFDTHALDSFPVTSCFFSNSKSFALGLSKSVVSCSSPVTTLTSCNCAHVHQRKSAFGAAINVLAGTFFWASKNEERKAQDSMILML